MRVYDRATTEAFFNTTFSDAQKMHVDRNPGERLHPRDLILFDRLFNKTIPTGGKMIDYACGHGRLLVEMLSRGYDCVGVEKHPGMRKIAVQELAQRGFGEDRILLGSLDALKEIKAKSVDVFIAMGLFQYLDDAEFDEVLGHAVRVLKSGGHFIATFQNAFFDLFTFNKYSVDFFVNDLLADALPKDANAQVEGLIDGLLVNPEKPPYASDRARDNIFVRLSNPLTMPAVLAEHGLSHSKTYYYEYFGLPPLLSGKAPEIAKTITKKYEVVDAENWRGMFMANAFLCHATRN